MHIQFFNSFQTITLCVLMISSCSSLATEGIGNISDEDLNKRSDSSVLITEKALNEMKSNTYSLSQDDISLIQGGISLAKEMMKQPDLMEMAENPHTEEVNKIIEDDYAVKRPVNVDPITGDYYNPNVYPKTVVFLSRSMGKAGIKQAYDFVYNTDATVVYRGVMPGKSVAQRILSLQVEAKDLDPMPNIQLNPPLFDKYNVSEVPTIIRIDKDGQVVSKVVGISNPGWLDDQLPKQEDFGRRGPTEEIVEPSLIDVMKAKVAAMDWKSKKEAAVKNFWKKRNNYSLPTANTDRLLTIDPSVHITADIKTASGELIAEKGSVINPLDKKDFDMALIVFNPNEKRQLERVKEELKGLRKKYQDHKIMLIASEFDTQQTWDGYKEITDFFNKHVYRLNESLQERFRFEYVPSILTADKTSFYISELGMLEDPLGEL